MSSKYRNYSLLEWFSENEKKIGYEPVVCLITLIIIFESGAHVYLNEITLNFIRGSYCLAEFIWFHFVIGFFSMLVFIKTGYQLSLLKKYDSFSDLIAYINEDTDERLIFGQGTVKRKRRKFKSLFVLVAMSIAFLFLAFDWIAFLTTCTSSKSNFNFSLLALACYVFILVRAPFFFLALIRFLKL